MVKTEKFRMPAGIRNKLLAAVAMLLVSSIMMVSTTYAWFTLSTAPEVTGITTSVGANGNLEMALLTTESFANLSEISSAVGDSSAKSALTKANTTWGNLVDLSDAAYMLNDIVLAPAALNYTETAGTTGEGESQTTTVDKVSVTNPLLIAQYGKDGRVIDTKGNTVSAIATNGVFAYGSAQSYGVRAVGTTSNLSAREIALRNAKSVVNTTASSAQANTRTAISNNANELLGYATADSTPTRFTVKEVKAFANIANGVVSSLAVLEKGYKNAVIAKVATTATSDEEFATAKTAIEEMTLSALKSAASTYSIDESMQTAIDSLVTAQESAGAAKTTLDAAVNLTTEITSTTTTTTDNVIEAIKKLIGESFDKDTTSEDAAVVVYIANGAVGEIAKQVGKYQLYSAGSLGSVYAGAKAAESTGSFNGVNGVVSTVMALSITNSNSADANITDTYGYIIDFAFRTNASSSKLQLQTKAMNRVYSDQTNTDLATQGSGSVVTYSYNSEMTTEQVEKLLGAIKLVFLSGKDGTVLATAGMDGIQIDTVNHVATADIKLKDQTGDSGEIVDLSQNTATAISVLVYMDGNQIDNSAVVNGADSGSLNLNLQFSSSATLVPMNNTALKNMVVTYKEKTLTNSEYLYNGQTYTVKEGFTLYDGSDNMVYFAQGDSPTSYTKLTPANYTTVLTLKTDSEEPGN